MSSTRRLFLAWCHVTRDPQSVWQAYTPYYDMSASGSTSNGAWLNLKEAVRTQILDDLNNSLDPNARRSNDDADWGPLVTVLEGYSVREKDDGDGEEFVGDWVIPITTYLDMGPPIELLSEDIYPLYERAYFNVRLPEEPINP
jgi:hypothetical protein